MNIAIISPGSLPIPSVLGGAIETLTTNLIFINEKEDEPFEFTVYNQYNSKANIENIYNFTKLVFIKNKGVFSFIYNIFWRIIRKVTYRKIIYHSFFINRCIKHIKKQNFDYILVEGDYNQILQIDRKLNVKIIYHIHTDILKTTTLLCREITKACYMILCVSEFLKKRILEIDEANCDKTFVFKNAIDLKRFDRNLNFRNIYREKLGLNDDDILIIYCGRLSKEKGVKELLLAYEKIKEQNCKLIIVGSSWFSSNKSNEYTDNLKKIASRFNDKIIFTGYIQQNELPHYYSAADILVCPSICNEAAGLVVIEALACGIPVIVSNIGGIPEYAKSDSCELVDCDENFVDNLMVSLEKLISDTEYYQNKQKQARKSVAEFNLVTYYENFRKIIMKEG